MIPPPQLAAPDTPLTVTIATSQLLDGLALHRAVSHVAAQHPTSDEDHDRRLAERLVETGLLNLWQVEQLKRGRTKFSLGPYRIFDSIARGGMGHVFKAEHEMLGRIEAIKVLPRSKSTPDAITSFRHEMRAQAALDHPNLVRVSNAGCDGETFYFVTEFVPGIDLRRLIRRRGPLEESVAAWVVGQAAEAIHHAHRRGLVHRDVKPGNLLLTPTGTIKVTDLGLAFSLDGLLETNDVDTDAKIAGTSDYLAPEAIRRPDLIRPASDLYGLGCTLYYAVTGKVPFPGGTHLDKLRRRVREEPLDPLKLVPSLSPAIVALIRSAMARRPELRPKSAAEMATSLAELSDDTARERLAVVVTDCLARRASLSDTTPAWATGDADDLPETIDLPLHEVTAPMPADWLPPLKEEAPSPPTKEVGEPPPTGKTAAWVTAGALVLNALILTLAALRSWFG